MVPIVITNYGVQMRKNIVLIDFENVQPEISEQLSLDHVHVVVFVGANQTKLPIEIAVSLQKLGSKAEYVRISGNGSNALDFHIAYFIGTLSATDPTAYFHILSKDTGFDPLIQYLSAKKICVRRVQDIGDIPVVKTARAKSPAERVPFVVEKLARQQASKPSTVKTLANSIAAQFQNQLPEDQVTAVIEFLKKQGHITVDGSKVTYPRNLV